MQVCTARSIWQITRDRVLTVWKWLLKGVADLKRHAVGETLLPRQLVATRRLQGQRMRGRSGGCGPNGRQFTFG
jgi:hypothetical protein